jgi:uncharacterized membrane protein YphA (DoxX/SURF4 family)
MLRIAVGVMFIWMGYSYLFKDRIAIITQISTRWPKFASFIVYSGGIIEIITGIFLVAGFLTQIAAIVGVLMAMDALSAKILYKDLDKAVKYSKMFYVLVLIICLSLIVSGAGAFAIDLPL